MPSALTNTLCYPKLGVPSQCVLEFVWRGVRLDEDIGSGSAVNRLVSELLDENCRSLADEPIIRLILDGTVVRVRLDRVHRRIDVEGIHLFASRKRGH
jgi:hypothetical protein